VLGIVEEHSLRFKREFLEAAGIGAEHLAQGEFFGVGAMRFEGAPCGRVF
jgi:hypothetical protein